MERMGDTPKGGRLKEWKCTAAAMRAAYGQVDWTEEETVKWFGRNYDFDDYPGAKAAKRGARYGDFGTYNPGASEYAAQYESMPEKLKLYIKPTDLGYYKDALNREYKPRSENPEDEEYGEYEVRLPRKYFPLDRRLDDPDFPVDGEEVVLEGKGRRVVARVNGGVYEQKEATALVELEFLQEL